MSLSLPTQFYCGRRAGTRRSCRRRGEHADLYRYLKASIREAAKSAGCELTSIAAPSGLRERSIVRRSRLTKERRETGTQLVYARYRLSGKRRARFRGAFAPYSERVPVYARFLLQSRVDTLLLPKARPP
ncbi:unnamed protein product, partial [Iphiclides podalirius]